MAKLWGGGGGEWDSGILPEMVKTACCEEGFFHLLMDLVYTVWCECRVSKEWSDAVLVPIPKKGNFDKCDNWRGIALLDVVGKIIARILQEQLLAEDVLPELQCGFRKTRECTDKIFTIHQLVEKSWEYRAKSFITFIDLKKAYNSVPRSAMWLALGKLGVPENTIKLIHSFHQGMEVRICLDEVLLEEFSVENGLRQSCCMALVLVNLYTCLVMECWQARVEDVREWARCQFKV